MKKLRIIALLMICFAVMYIFSGCGVNHDSPEGIVKSLVKYSEKGKDKKILDCYGLDKDADEATKTEVASTIEYFQAMKSDGITLVACDTIEDFGDYAYVYISYLVDLKKDKAYPRIETYLVKRQDKDYCVIPTKDITTEMSEAAMNAYATFMASDAYKQYQNSYDEFILKNPNFEEELAIKLGD